MTEFAKFQAYRAVSSSRRYRPSKWEKIRRFKRWRRILINSRRACSLASVAFAFSLRICASNIVRNITPSSFNLQREFPPNICLHKQIGNIYFQAMCVVTFMQRDDVDNHISLSLRISFSIFAKWCNGSKRFHGYRMNFSRGHEKTSRVKWSEWLRVACRKESSLSQHKRTSKAYGFAIRGPGGPESNLSAEYFCRCVGATFSNLQPSNNSSSKLLVRSQKWRYKCDEKRIRRRKRRTFVQHLWIIELEQNCDHILFYIMHIIQY